MQAARARTLKELAERLGVSVTTVSRALAGHEQIARRTRERVAQAARDMGYVPNIAGRQLVSGRSNFVGFIIPLRGPNFMDSYLGEFVTGLSEGLVSHGIDLIIATVQSGQSELDVLRHLVESGRADGVVIPRIAAQDERVEYLCHHDFPFVAHGRVENPELTYSWLDADGQSAFEEAFDLLYALGHRHFGIVSISEEMTFRNLRERGFKLAMERRNDPELRLDIVRAPRFDRGEMVSAIGRLLDAPNRPTAIMGLFDEIALTIMDEAKRREISIPRDMSVLGFDNIAASAYAPPGLTTFEVETRSMAREIAHILVRRIEGEPAGQGNTLIRPTLVARASHGPVPLNGH
ncbi:LacI family DNA-binding transcriptional regulator [Pelagibacterium halotolerans]|uniref:LacI family DNA-binding transcriptional regulator n=1 Tax=Pelagibacterium halotolerans TaxID=531813 RepID=UPI00089B9428|nr:LacI family DNA-binding transcriptional regulator [Pelagibacterium halotolerans]SEA90733.1 transcriptional regulator, LacI family [Pelagibacterium halotolerans]